MDRTYSQLSLEERCQISELQKQGRSVRQIAAALGRSPSSISRELKRNVASQVAGYTPVHADELAWARRWTGSKLDRDESLRERVLGRLLDGWSPAQVAGRLAREEGRDVISHETIYRFIYAQIRRTNDFNWRKYLPKAKYRRGYRPGKGGSPASFIKGRIPVHQRPSEALDRQTPGHWEADYMLFSRYGQSALVLHERTSRMTAIALPPNRQAGSTVQALHDMLEPIPEHLRLTLTVDNGTEFATHYELGGLGMQTYFCDTHSPWQKGGIENAIGRLRRYLPRKTNLDATHPDYVRGVAWTYNHTPRRCLDFQTPAEVFSQVLHFKCESISRHSPG